MGNRKDPIVGTWRTASRLYWRQLAKLIDLLEGRRGQDGTQGTARLMSPSRSCS